MGAAGNPRWLKRWWGEVKAVYTTITKGKSKRFRGQSGRRKDVKMACVTQDVDNMIDVSTWALLHQSA